MNRGLETDLIMLNNCIVCSQKLTNRQKKWNFQDTVNRNWITPLGINCRDVWLFGHARIKRRIHLKQYIMHLCRCTVAVSRFVSDRINTTCVGSRMFRQLIFILAQDRALPRILHPPCYSHVQAVFVLRAILKSRLDLLSRHVGDM